MLKQLKHCTSALKIIFLIFFVALVGACATQPLATLSIEQQISLLQKADKYGAAQRILDDAKPEKLDIGKVDALAEHNRTIAAEFERAVISDASLLQKNSEWGAATERLESAMQAYPESDKLDDAAKKLQVARDSFVQSTLLKHQIFRAKQLPLELKNLRALEDATTDSGLSLEYKRLQEEATSVAEYLLQQGQKSMALKQWKRSNELLSLSFALKTDQRTSTALRLVETNYKPAARKPAKKRSEETTDSSILEAISIDSGVLAAQAMNRYRARMQQNDLAGASQFLAEAKKLEANDKEIEKESRRLGSLIANAVETRVEQGKYEYSQGNIDQAIGHWEYAFSLTPEDEYLKERLGKARLFKQRYERLKR